MIGRFLRRQAPPARVVHYSPAQYMRARSEGRGMVRVELPSTESPGFPHVPQATTERPQIRAVGGPAESDPAGPPTPPRRSPFCADGPAAPSYGAAGTAFDAFAGHYGDYGNPNVND